MFPLAHLCAEQAGVEWFLASGTSWACNLGSPGKSRIYQVDPRALVLTDHFYSVNLPTIEWDWADRSRGHMARVLYVYSVLGQLSPTKVSQPVLSRGFRFPLLSLALDSSKDVWGGETFVKQYPHISLLWSKCYFSSAYKETFHHLFYYPEVNFIRCMSSWLMNITVSQKDCLRRV